MSEENLTEIVAALHGLAMAQAGRLAALQAVSDAWLITLSKSLPPLSVDLAKHIEGIAKIAQDGLADESIAAYQAALSEALALLKRP